jgi:hypothetical protein
MTSAAANFNLETCDTATDEIVPKRNASSLTIFFVGRVSFQKIVKCLRLVLLHLA